MYLRCCVVSVHKTTDDTEPGSQKFLVAWFGLLG